MTNMAEWAGEQEISYDAALPAELLDLLQKLLAKDPACRIRIQEIKQHPWFRAPPDVAAPETVSVTQVLPRPLALSLS
jgi:serine/threonine protein kinase